MNSEAEEARRLLDNGYRVLLFVDGIGQYSALAIREEQSVDSALEAWANHEVDFDAVTPAESIYDGPNRYCGCGHTIGHALHALAEKVFLRQIPKPPTDEGK